jgi:threonine synthase
MELWHGPTSAFKDIALTILPRLLTAAYQKENRNDQIAILTATSGDTGKAALIWFCGCPAYGHHCLLSGDRCIANPEKTDADKPRKER